MRDLNNEYQNSDNRKYAYNFDYIHRDYMIKQFEPLLLNATNILEMGCFEGEFTKKLLPYGENITVVEGASELIKFAKQNINHSKVKFIHSMFENLDLDEKFDLVFLIHTLEHLDERTLILNKISDLLTTNGKLVLIVPNANAASRQIAVNMGLIEFNTAVTEGEKSHGHRVTYNLDTLIAEVERSDLSIFDFGGILFKPLANFQIDKALESNIIDEKFLDGCFKLGKKYPDLCASIYVICEKQA